MLRWIRRVSALAVLALVVAVWTTTAPGAALAQDLPKPVGYVNDFAGVIPDEVRSSLEDALRQTEQETSVEAVLVTVPDLGGSTIEEYAVRLFEEWQIGKKGEDNGVLLILAVEERKVRIEVGYGLEPYITDGRAGRILDESVIPDLRQDNFALGLARGALAIRTALDESGYTSGEPPRAEAGALDGISNWLWLIVVAGGFSVYLFSYMARTRSIWLGGIWGAGAGAAAGWILAPWLGILVGIAGGAVLGLALDAILSSAYRNQSSAGRPTGWTHTWGGFSGAGRGPGTGGGFGGFGGGRSGGGGASRGF